MDVQAQNNKTRYRTCQRRPPLPLRTDIFEDFHFDTAAAEQNNRQAVTLSQTERTTAHVSAVCAAVLKSRAHSSVGKCSLEADSSTQNSRTVPLCVCGAVVRQCCVEKKQCVHCELLTDGTANSIKILSVAQNAAMATLMSLATTKPSDIFM